ncbi:Fic family protein [Selenomonas ruminantium]|uniref:Fic/DOC family protein n=1 Tax=Selenomonas ruminantium TaxID=971 RepID=A0A1H0NYM0_SELRU|nr:Fic family protein [Selenomonas ruminantium]SDO97636.1 Fic/DOC family protein [Selenomonas ruminantium]
MNHFRAFDFILQNYAQSLNEKIIKHLHKILKTNTTDADLDWFNVGEYKALANTIGDKENSPPDKVTSDMEKLIDDYLMLSKYDFHTLLKFHVDFEAIHPFQDGNGRVGRLLLFKECLNHGIIPFIIDNDHKQFYSRGLREIYRESGYLTDTCLSAQDKYTAYCKHFVKDFR